MSPEYKGLIEVCEEALLDEVWEGDVEPTEIPELSGWFCE